jgi:hypothetical protein
MDPDIPAPRNDLYLMKRRQPLPSPPPADLFLG